MDEQAPRGRHGLAPYAIGPESVGWLVVGAGQTAGPRFVDAIRQLPARLPERVVRGWVIGVCSHSESRAHQFALRYQLPFSSAQIEDALAWPALRCVYVANHPRHHAESVRASLQAGKHVLCEPPLSLDLADAKYLRQFARERGLVLALNYQRRGDPAVIEARRIIADHEIGDILGGRLRNGALLPLDLQSWRVQAEWAGVLLERTLRSADLVRVLFGQSITSVSAVAGPNILGHRTFEDVHTLFQLADNHQVVHVHDSFLLGHVTDECEVHGSAATLRVEWQQPNAAGSIQILRNGIARNVTLPHAGLHSSTLMAGSILAVQDAIVTGGPVPADAYDDFMNFRIVEAVTDSLLTKRHVEIESALTASRE